MWGIMCHPPPPPLSETWGEAASCSNAYDTEFMIRSMISSMPVSKASVIWLLHRSECGIEQCKKMGKSTIISYKHNNVHLILWSHGVA